MLERITYHDLNSRQQENYNFHKAAAVLADYGFNCLRLSDDWQGADFIACHINGQDFLKVQLKGRLSISRKYVGKNIHVAFWDKSNFYLYPHDEVMDRILAENRINASKSWAENGDYNWPYLSDWVATMMQAYRVNS